MRGSVRPSPAPVPSDWPHEGTVSVKFTKALRVPIDEGPPPVFTDYQVDEVAKLPVEQARRYVRNRRAVPA